MQWRIGSISEPLALALGGGNKAELITIALPLADGCTFVEQRSGGASIHAFATGSTARGLAPGLVQIADDVGVATAIGHIPSVCPF